MKHSRYLSCDIFVSSDARVETTVRGVPSPFFSTRPSFQWHRVLSPLVLRTLPVHGGSSIWTSFDHRVLPRWRWNLPPRSM